MRVRVLPPVDYVSPTGVMFAADAIKRTFTRLPVFVGSDHQQAIGEAAVYPNGTADILMTFGDVDFGAVDGSEDDQAFTVDARVVKSHSVGGGLMVDELEAMAVSLLPRAHICGARNTDGALCSRRPGHSEGHDWPDSEDEQFCDCSVPDFVGRRGRPLTFRCLNCGRHPDPSDRVDVLRVPDLAISGDRVAVLWSTAVRNAQATAMPDVQTFAQLLLDEIRPQVQRRGLEV